MKRLTGYNSFGGVYGINMGAEDNTDVINAILKRLAYYEDLEEQGRLIILSKQDVHPCNNCNASWASMSSKGYHSCMETCEKRKEWEKSFTYFKGE